METLNIKVLSLLVATGSTMAGEIRTAFGAANPHRCISDLRKTGYPIRDYRIWGNEKVYYLKKQNDMKKEEKKERHPEQRCENCGNLFYIEKCGYICILSDKWKELTDWCMNWEDLPF